MQLYILLVDSDTFVANTIHKFQGNRWNHAGMLVEAYGERYVVEAIETGIGFTPFSEYAEAYRKQQKDLMLLELNTELDVSEAELMKFILPYTRTGYEYSNLIGHQAIKFITKKIFGKALWLGRRKRKGDKKFICGEWCAFVINYYVNLFPEWHKIAPSDLFDSIYLKHKKIDKYV